MIDSSNSDTPLDALPVDTGSVPAHLVLFSNGMVGAFDTDGKQIPYYQGRHALVIEKLRGLDLSQCLFESGVWGMGLQPITQDQFFSL